MDKYRELRDRLSSLHQANSSVVMQGIVRAVSGYLAEVEVEGLTIPDVRLRASAVSVQGAMLLIPAVGSVVLVGSLSGDMTELAVLYVDKVDRVELSGEVVLNGGNLGGLINIEELTAKLNALVHSINTHTHTSAAQGSPTTPPLTPLDVFRSSDYEDTTIKH